MKKTVTHELEPFYNHDSLVLILGSMPSIKSKELEFYYMHPQNRFWKVLSKVYQEQLPESIDEKKSFLIKHKIALWDVIQSCEIQGSSDSSIANVIPNNINKVLKNSKVIKIFTTGKKAYELYNKYCISSTEKEATYLPSTSPAYCPKNIENILLDAYSIIRDITK